MYQISLYIAPLILSGVTQSPLKTLITQQIPKKIVGRIKNEKKAMFNRKLGIVETVLQNSENIGDISIFYKDKNY